MKKFLLFAAAAAAMMCASAQVNVEQLWKHSVTNLTTNDVRQGFGMDGKIFINDKANEKVIVFGQGGLADEEYPGGTNCGITCDEAGNIIVSTAAFPGAWPCDGETPVLKVYNPSNPAEVKEYFLTEDAIIGRCDMIGFAKGNLMENGVIYLCGGASEANVYILTIADGVVDLDNSYMATAEGVTATTSNVINYYKNKDGEDRLLYVYRSAAPRVQVLVAEGDNFAIEETVTLPGKSASNGAQIFTWDGEEYAVYPCGGNYLDGFSIAKVGDEEALYVRANEYTANPNGITCNWVNAEVNATDNSVMIYHYVPGAYVEAYKMTKGETPVEPKFYVCGGFNGWNAEAPLEITEEGATFDVVEDPEDVESKEFKILTNGESDWLWLGGEDANGVGYFEITDGMMTDATEITLDDAGANFRLPGSGNYTITLAKEAASADGSKAPFEGVKIVVKNNTPIPTAITDVNNKAVKSVKYVNIAGQVSEVPFDGVNVMVTTYTDGTRAASKVIK